MPKKPRRTKRPELLNRAIDVVSFRTGLRVWVDEPKDLSRSPLCQASATSSFLLPERHRFLGGRKHLGVHRESIRQDLNLDLSIAEELCDALVRLRAAPNDPQSGRLVS